MKCLSFLWLYMSLLLFEWISIDDNLILVRYSYTQPSLAATAFSFYTFLLSLSNSFDWLIHYDGNDAQFWERKRKKTVILLIYSIRYIFLFDYNIFTRIQHLFGCNSRDRVKGTFPGSISITFNFKFSLSLLFPMNLSEMELKKKIDAQVKGRKSKDSPV